MRRGIRVLIAGEGPNEIGDSEHPGTIDAFIAKIDPGAEVSRRIAWKDITKLRPNWPDRGDELNVHRLALHATEQGCNAPVFLRDRDGQKKRERVIRAAAGQAAKDHKGLRIAGGVPIEMLESWMLALKSLKDTEQVSDPKATLRSQHSISTTAGMVELIRNSTLLTSVPSDAGSLREWLRNLAIALKVKPPRWPKG